MCLAGQISANGEKGKGPIVNKAIEPDKKPSRACGRVWAETGCDTVTSACIGESDESGHVPEDDWMPGATGSYNNRLGVSREQPREW